MSPLHHINCFSVRGGERLLARAGLEDVVVTTAGQLDVDIVRNAAARDPWILEGHCFLAAMLAREGPPFQECRSQNRLSAHAWITDRRAEC